MSEKLGCALMIAPSPWLTHLVITGGWAHGLYRLHPSAQRLEYPPLVTLDMDIAVPTRLKVTDRDIRERLIANGFEEERFRPRPAIGNTFPAG